MLKLFKHEGLSLAFVPLGMVILNALATIFLMIMANVDSSSKTALFFGNWILEFFLAGAILIDIGILISKSSKSIELYKLADISQFKLILSRALILFVFITITSALMVSELTAVAAVGYRKIGEPLLTASYSEAYALFNRPFAFWLICLSNGFFAVVLYFLSLAIVPILRRDFSKTLKYTACGVTFALLFIACTFAAPYFANIWPEANFNVAVYNMEGQGKYGLTILPSQVLYQTEYFNPLIEKELGTSAFLTINFLCVGELLFYFLLCSLCFMVYSLCYKVYSKNNRLKEKMTVVKITTILVAIVSMTAFYFYASTPPKVPNTTDKFYGFPTMVYTKIGEEIDLTQYYSLDTVKLCEDSPRLYLTEKWGYSADEEGEITYIEGEDFILNEDKTKLTVLKDYKYLYFDIYTTDKYTKETLYILRIRVTVGEKPVYPYRPA